MENSSRYTAITEAAGRVLSAHEIEVWCLECKRLKEIKPCNCDDPSKPHRSDGLHTACVAAHKAAFMGAR